MVEELTQDLYEILKLKPDCTQEDIRNAFRQQSRIYHPDKQRSQTLGSGNRASSSRQGPGGLDFSENASAEEDPTVTFQRIDRAYRILSDETLRQFYDKYGLEGIKLASTVPKETYDPPSSDESDYEMDGDSPAAGRPAGSQPPRKNANANVNRPAGFGDFGKENGVADDIIRGQESSDTRLVKTVGDRMDLLEGAVKKILRTHQELELPRKCGLQGSTIFAFQWFNPDWESPNTLAKSRSGVRMQYSAFHHGVHLYNDEKKTVAFFATSHMLNQGAGVVKLAGTLSHQLDAYTTFRSNITSTGVGISDADFTLSRKLSKEMSLQSTVALNRDFQLKQLSWSLSTKLEDDSFLVCQLDSVDNGKTKFKTTLEKKLSKLLSTKMVCSMGADNVECSGKLTYCPSDLLSLSVGPSVSLEGPGLQAGVEWNNMPDELSKLSWTFSAKTTSVGVRLGLHRAGLNFEMPFEVRSMEMVHPDTLVVFGGLFVLMPLAIKLRHAPKKLNKWKRKLLHFLRKRSLFKNLWQRDNKDDGGGQPPPDGSPPSGQAPPKPSNTKTFTDQDSASKSTNPCSGSSTNNSTSPNQSSTETFDRETHSSKASGFSKSSSSTSDPLREPMHTCESPLAVVRMDCTNTEFDLRRGILHLHRRFSSQSRLPPCIGVGTFFMNQTRHGCVSGSRKEMSSTLEKSSIDNNESSKNGNECTPIQKLHLNLKLATSKANSKMQIAIDDDRMSETSTDVGNSLSIDASPRAFIRDPFGCLSSPLIAGF